ncbi:MAG: hypothetical protein F9K40_02970 [Kofleriaceae bacterium]|nr:MAG: hypothetical protein F9K40_02970 [Kofleriaceae bacterium]MBZ0233029.1 hypothetical protein [Kofleriaceae bacterium]
MRAILEQRRGKRVYVFTTFGAVYAAVVEMVNNDLVQLRGADGRQRFVNLADVSSVRDYDDEDR